jgi:DNA repair protein RadC
MNTPELALDHRAGVLELAAKYLAEELRRGDAIESPDATTTFLRCKLDRREAECFCVLFLDTRHRVIAFEELFHGTIDGATVYPRVVAKRALELNAAAVICAHNHPSGIAEPSRGSIHYSPPEGCPCITGHPPSGSCCHW